jgi:hypothetical protein
VKQSGRILASPTKRFPGYPRRQTSAGWCDPPAISRARFKAAGQAASSRFVRPVRTYRRRGTAAPLAMQLHICRVAVSRETSVLCVRSGNFHEARAGGDDAECFARNFYEARPRCGHTCGPVTSTIRRRAACRPRGTFSAHVVAESPQRPRQRLETRFTPPWGPLVRPNRPRPVAQFHVKRRKYALCAWGGTAAAGAILRQPSSRTQHPRAVATHGDCHVRRTTDVSQGVKESACDRLGDQWLGGNCARGTPHVGNSFAAHRPNHYLFHVKPFAANIAKTRCGAVVDSWTAMPEDYGGVASRFTVVGSAAAVPRTLGHQAVHRCGAGIKRQGALSRHLVTRHPATCVAEPLRECHTTRNRESPYVSRETDTGG